MAKEFVCTQCGHIGKPKTRTKGSILIEIVLWLLFIIPGVLYSLWRLISREEVCPKCGAPNMIPSDTPKGQELTNKQTNTV